MNAPSDAGNDTVDPIYSSLWINTCIGAACIFGFLLFRTIMKQYQLRSHLPFITIKPPPIPNTGFMGRVFGWIRPALATSDTHILRSAGLDALVLQKATAICMQLLAFMAFWGMALLLPLQYRASDALGDKSFTRLTMANVANNSPTMWAHLCVTMLFLVWTFLLLEWHTRQYTALRQHYLRGGDDPNYWRDLHMAEADGVMTTRATDGLLANRQQAKLVDALAEMRFREEMQAIEEEADELNDRLRWYQRTMLWLTSWTGTEDVTLAQYHRTTTQHSEWENIAENLVQGDFIRDAAANPEGATNQEPTAANASGAGAGTGAGAGAVSGGGARPLGEGTEARVEAGGLGQGNGLRARAQHLLHPRDEEEEQEEGHRAHHRPHLFHRHGKEDAKGLEEDEGVDVLRESAQGGLMCAPHQPRAMTRSRSNAELTAKVRQTLEELALGNEDEAIVAPKWYGTVDTVVMGDGRVRKLHASEINDQTQSLMLARPSVRFRKTINTYARSGKRIAVSAQQYAVLVTNVNRPCYPEYTLQPKKPVRKGAVARPPGALCCGNYPVMTQEDIEAAEAAAAAAAAAKGTSNPAGKEVGGLEKDVEAPALSSRPVLDPPRVPKGSEGGTSRGAYLWGVAREAVASGRLADLAVSPEFNIVAHVFSKLFPKDFDRTVPVFNFRKVDLLMRVWDQRCAQLENAQHFLKRTGQRRQMKTGGCCCNGCCCAHGPKVDAIDYLTAEVERLRVEIIRERAFALQYHGTQSWFVLFRTQYAAAVAASCNIHPMSSHLFNVHPAPGPEEVNWQALWFTHHQRTLRLFLVAPAIVVLVLLPVSLITSGITHLNSIICQAAAVKNVTDPAANLEEFKSSIDQYYCRDGSALGRMVKSLLVGFVPSLLITLWQSLALPRLIYLCAQSEGRHFSLSLVDRRMGSIYFYWNVFSMFLQGVIGGVAVMFDQALRKTWADAFTNADIGKLTGELGKMLSGSSKFFLVYMIMRSFMTVPLRFLITQPGVWQKWLRLMDLFKPCNDPTERATFMREAIRSPRYGAEFGSMTLIMLICYAFAAINPVITPFGCIFFAGMWLFWRYQLIYNYARKYESGGQMWPFLVNRLLVCAAIMVAFTGLVMVTKKALVEALLLWIVGGLATVAYYHRNLNRYQINIQEMPLLMAVAAPRARVPATVYVPPPLQHRGMGWYPEFNKVWEWFGMPGYSY